MAVLLIPFGGLIVAVLLLSMNEASKTWLEPLIASNKTNQGGVFTRILTLPSRLLQVAAASAFAAVSHSISVGASHRMGGLARWLRGVGTFAVLGAFTVAIFAHQTAAGFERLTGHVIPREIGRRTRPIDARAKRAGKAATIAGLLGIALRKRFNHVLGHELRPKLKHLAHQTTVALPRAIGRIGAREKGIEKELRHPSKRWLRRVAAAMWGTYLLGKIVRMLAKRFPWLFCRNVKRNMPKVCALDTELLDVLMLGATVTVWSMSLTSFAREAVVVSELFLDGLSRLLPDLLDVEADYLGGASGALPAAFHDYLGA